jgi:hypothetical protein
MKARTNDRSSLISELQRTLADGELDPNVPSIKERLLDIREALTLVSALVPKDDDGGHGFSDEYPDAAETVHRAMGHARDHVYFILEALTPELADTPAPGLEEDGVKALATARRIVAELSERGGAR